MVETHMSREKKKKNKMQPKKINKLFSTIRLKIKKIFL